MKKKKPQIYDNAYISIKGSSLIDEDESMEFFSRGEFACRGGDYYISYPESEMTGMEGATTTIKVEPNKVTISREGAVSTHMVFEKGLKHVSFYETDRGALLIGLLTRNINSTIGDAGGELEIDYTVEVDHFIAGEHSFSVGVKI